MIRPRTAATGSFNSTGPESSTTPPTFSALTRGLSRPFCPGWFPRTCPICGGNIEQVSEFRAAWRDRGFIGRVGTTLGEAGLNIGTFHLGRRSAGGEAVLLLSMDSSIAEPVLEQLRQLPGVKTVKALKF